MTNNNLHFVTSDASFEGLGLGWICPTANQPDYAGFFDSGSYANLAMGGESVQVNSQPQLTAGVNGQNPPYLTLSPSSYIQTQITPKDALTVVALCSLKTDQTSPLVSNYAGGTNCLQIRAGGSGAEKILHFYAQFPGGYVVSDLVGTNTLDKWAIRAFTLSIVNPDSSSPSASLGNYDITTNESQSGGPSSANSSVPSQAPLLIGADLGGTGEGSVNVNSIVISNNLMSLDDINSVASIMRLRAAAWGITV